MQCAPPVVGNRPWGGICNSASRPGIANVQQSFKVLVSESARTWWFVRPDLNNSEPFESEQVRPHCAREGMAPWRCIAPIRFSLTGR